MALDLEPGWLQRELSHAIDTGTIEAAGEALGRGFAKGRAAIFPPTWTTWTQAAEFVFQVAKEYYETNRQNANPDVGSGMNQAGHALVHEAARRSGL